MLLREVFDNKNNDSQQLLALCQFLLGRADNTDSQKKISVDAFIKLAANNGISLTPDQLMTMSQQPPLNGVIQNIEGNEIIFAGSEEPMDTMTQQQAELTVDQMAKRAAKKSL